VLEALSDGGVMHVTTKIMGLPDWYIEQGPQDFLRERYGLTAEGIYQSVKELIGKTAVSSREEFTLASSTDRLPHGDEQGS
jgi:1-deoxy-D-xylulose-5-phosphate synthase